MHIAICDDEITQVQLIKLYIRHWSEIRDISTECYGFASAEEYLMRSEENSFDLLFLDIQMGAISGIELAQSLRRHNERLAIVFVTGLREHVFSGFEVQALHYLVKPIKESDCHKCLDLALDRMQNQQQKMLLFNHEGELQKIPFAAIIYAESTGHYVRLVTTDAEYRGKVSLSDLEKELEGGGFFRCHRSYLLNMRHVARITPTDAVLDDGNLIPVSRQNRDGLNQAFINYYRGRM